MIFAYRLIYYTFHILLRLLRPILPVKTQELIELRNQKILKIKNFNQTYWFHASSGEIEYCKSVIRLLKQKKPNAEIVVTYSSPSAERLFQNIKNDVDQFLPLPWDRPQKTQELIDYIQPQVLVFSRTDLWPELIHQAHKKSIKIGVLSYNPNMSKLTKTILIKLLPKFSFISCVDEQVKNSLYELDPNLKVQIDGDTRFDQVFYRLSQEPKIKINTDKKIIVCGSTWPQDEDVLLNCFQDFIFTHKMKIVLSPHEVSSDNINRIVAKLNSIGLSSQKLSGEKQKLNINLNSDVLIIDQIGYLADAYRDATIAFVGGSFKDKVHSVMEPLCCGLPVVTGPFYKNNPEAIKYHQRFVFSLNNSNDILLKLPSLLQMSKMAILNEMKKNQNASERIINFIQA